MGRKNNILIKKRVYLNADVSGCLARLPGSQFSNFTFNIFTSPNITILGRLVRFTIGFLDGRDLPHLKAWNRDFEAKWGRDWGCTGWAIAKINFGITGLSGTCDATLCGVRQPKYRNNELSLYQSPSFLDEIDTLYFVLSVPVSTVVSSRGNNFLSDKQFSSTGHRKKLYYVTKRKGRLSLSTHVHFNSDELQGKNRSKNNLQVSFTWSEMSPCSPYPMGKGFLNPKIETGLELNFESK